MKLLLFSWPILSRIFLTGSILSLTLLSACQEKVKPSPPPPLPLSGDILVVNDHFENTPIVIAGSGGRKLLVSFLATLDNGTVLSFNPVQHRLPILLKSEDETLWDIFGDAVEGPLTGTKLKPTHSYMGYWFAFGAMYPGVQIYGMDSTSLNINPSPPSPDWTIPKSEVFAATGADAIAAIDNPEIFTFWARNYLDEPYYLQDDELVVGVKIGDEIRAYPHAILDWHEIVNDEFGSEKIALIYCPFTGTATAWSRILGGVETTFGVSGLLHNNNVIPFDRASNSRWSQLLRHCINGPQIASVPTPYPVIETSWGNWKDMFELPDILSEETGFNLDYAIYPYGSYRSNHNSLTFPLSYDDDRLPRKERVHAIIINGQAKAYRLSSF